MSFIRHHKISIGLFTAIVLAVCLLALFSAEHALSYRKTAPAVPAQSTGSMSYEVVTTQAAQELGLGGRSVIPDNYGMLFVFPQDGTYGFWMKDMLVPIDMVWVAVDGTIVSIEVSVPPDSYPRVFYPSQPSRYVVETRSGFAAANGWKVGVKVPLPLPYSK